MVSDRLCRRVSVPRESERARHQKRIARTFQASLLICLCIGDVGQHRAQLIAPQLPHLCVQCFDVCKGCGELLQDGLVCSDALRQRRFNLQVRWRSRARQRWRSYNLHSTSQAGCRGTAEAELTLFIFSADIAAATLLDESSGGRLLSSHDLYLLIN